ncbi:hypothetical protein [Pararobbsia alpina]|nr:hypothetical protein [Pararobbsia alpina]
MTKAFAPGRDPRSAEYKAGGRAMLEKRVNGVALDMPYVLGMAQADAYMAGWDEANSIFRALRDTDK